MKINLKSLLVAAGFTLFAVGAQAAVKSGETAPDFELLGHDGKNHKLSDYKGKHVVLEWFNEGCPYVKKHYDAPDMNMQALQKKYGEKNVVWLTVVSSSVGEQGYVDVKGAPDMIKSHKANPTAMLLDPEGKVGKMFDAKVTPHMYVINGDGKLVYQGAIDDQASARPETLEGANNYVRAAWADLDAGRAVQTAQTTPYGCNVKYAT